MPINLLPVKSGYNLSVINDNFETIEATWDEKLDRLVSEQGNFMDQALDMNNNSILNTTVTDEPTSLVNKKYVDDLVNEAGIFIWESVGEWNTNPLITKPNQYVYYQSGNQRLMPTTLPYQVDSVTYPNPQVLVDSGELIDVSDYVDEEQARELIENAVTWDWFGVIADGVTPQNSEVFTAINDAISKDLVISDPRPVALDDTFYLPENTTFGKVKFVAVGSEWATNTLPTPTDRNDPLGQPMLVCNLDGLSYQELELDCGLLTIDPVNQDIAASGICFNTGRKCRGGITKVHHYNRYGVWHRVFHTDSTHETITTNQWSFGEKGWLDNSARTAAGWVNSSGDFAVNNLISWYNLENITMAEGCFTTHIGYAHPYNGSDTPAANTNIRVYSGTGQAITYLYNDNGAVDFSDTAVITIGTLRNVNTASSSLQTTFRFTANTGVEVDLSKCNIGLLETALNSLYTELGAGTTVNKPIIRSIKRLTDNTTSTLINPFIGYEVEQTQDGRNKLTIKNSDKSTVVDNSTGLISLREDKVNSLLTGATNVNQARVAIAGNLDEDMAVQPQAEETFASFYMGTSNGIDFGTITNLETPHVQFEARANEDLTPTEFGTKLHILVCRNGTTTASPALVIKGDSVHPGSDNFTSLGLALKRFTEVFAVNGTIQTSDETKKEFDPEYDDSFFEGIPNAVLDAWSEIPIVRFKWKHEIERYENGERDTAPRWHVGRKAQDIERSFSKHGLDAHEYGVFCYDQWEESVIEHKAEYTIQLDENDQPVLDEDGNPIKVKIKDAWTEVLPAGEIYSVRDNEAANIEAACQRREIERLKSLLQA